MPNNLLNKNQWIKLGLFFLSVILGVISVLFNQIEFALMASLVMGFSFWGLKENHFLENETVSYDKPEISSDRLILTIALFIYAVLFGIGAIYFSKNPGFDILSLVLWLIFIVLIISAGIIFDRVKPFAWLKRIKNFSPVSRRRLVIEISIISVITAVALALRVTHLDLYPHVMHGDEGETGMDALRVLGFGDPLPPFGVGWGLLPNLLYYMVAVSIKIFGRNEIGVRMISALFGVACVPLVYLIGRKFWGKLAGFSGAWLVSVNHFSIHYSRIGLNIIEATFFMLLFILLFLVPNSRDLSEQDQEPNNADISSLLKNKFSIIPHIVVGLICGLAQYMYLGSRLIVLVALPLYAFLLIKKRINIIQVAVVALTAILVFAPLGTYYLQHPIDFTGRMETVSIFNPDNIKNIYGQNATLTNSLGLIIKNQFTRNLNFYLQAGDGSSFYDGSLPAFDFITAFLFWLGLGVVFSRPQRLPEMTLILWFVLGLIFGGVLTNDSPTGSRLLISTPAIFIIGGVFVQRTWNILNDFFKKIPNVNISLGWLISPMVICVLIATLGINMNYYFVVYPKSMVTILPITLTKEIILDSPVDHVYILGDGDIYANHGTIRFLAGENSAMNLQKIEDLPALVKDGKGVTVLATFSHFEEINSLKSIYPQGEMSEKYVLGNLIFVKYRIPPLD
jgi:4-amino-4-deoxy-L-arabinose transferase-like glycosyltransferase